MTTAMCVHACSVAQLCLTLCDPMDCSPLGSSVHGIFETKILECVAMLPPGDFSDPGIEPMSPVAPALTGGFFTTEPPGKHTAILFFYFENLFVQIA